MSSTWWVGIAKRSSSPCESRKVPACWSTSPRICAPWPAKIGPLHRYDRAVDASQSASSEYDDCAMSSRTAPRNRLAKPLPDEWRKFLTELGTPKRKYTAICRTTLADGRVIEELIIEEGWIIALNREGLAGIFEQRIDFDPRSIVEIELLQVV